MKMYSKHDIVSLKLTPKFYKFITLKLLPVTVTTNSHVPVLPAVSVDEQLTVVSPRLKVSLDGGEQVTVGFASTLSVAVGLNATVVEKACPISVTAVVFWQSTTGASLSF